MPGLGNNTQAAALREITDILAWRRVSSVPAVWMSLYDKLLLDCLDRLENRIFAEAISLLSADDRQQLHRSPMIAQQLLSFRETGGFDESFMANALLAALAEAGIPLNLTVPLWTARGDRRLDPGSHEHRIAARENLGGTGAVIDFESPYFSEYEGANSALMLDSGECVLAKQKIVRALDFVRETSEIAWSFWASAIDVIVIRKIIPAMPGLVSNTSASKPRGMTLINVHLEQVTLALLADGLLHEAIHSLLFTYERIAKPFLTDAKRSQDVLVPSPWSDRNLRLISFIHACIVWYGLYCFWTIVLERGGSIVDRYVVESDRVLAGFRQRPVSKGLAPHKHLLSLEAIQLLEELEVRMLASG